MPDEPTYRELQRENERLRKLLPPVRTLARFRRHSGWSGNPPRKLVRDVAEAYDEYAEAKLKDKLDTEES